MNHLSLMSGVFENQTTLAGFTLLEVLVSVVIFSIGLLGLATLQIQSLRLSHDSLFRTQAFFLATDMADRIRANTQASALGTTSPYNNPTGSMVANASCLGIDGSGAANGDQCTPVEMANHDFYEWNALIQGAQATGWHPVLEGQLPLGAGIVCIDSTPDDGLPPPNDPLCDNLLTTPGTVMFTIKIWWTERKNLDTPNPVFSRFVTSFSL